MIRLKVNNNGTSADELIRQRIEANAAMLKTIEAFRQTAPHRRDYQTCEPGEYEKDRHDFTTRLGHLTFFSDQLISDAIIIQEQK